MPIRPANLKGTEVLMSTYDYWGFQSSPFDNVPDPTMYFSSHATVDAAVAELLFAIAGNECLAVLVGEVGLGKTMALRMISKQLDSTLYRMASIPNPDLTFLQLLREIIGQLEGNQCKLRDRASLLRELNRILTEEIDDSQKVVVLIDEGNCLRPSALEGLRQLTNMQRGTRNALTLVLAGQPKLAKILEDPRRGNLFQRIGVYCRLKPLDTPELVRDYIEHRVERAGSTRQIFSPGAFQNAYRHTGGIPRLINRLCKLSLKAAETHGLTMVNGEILDTIAARFAPNVPSGNGLASNKGNGHKSATSNGRQFRKRIEQSRYTEPAPPALEAPDALQSSTVPRMPHARDLTAESCSFAVPHTDFGAMGATQPPFRLLKSHGKDWRVPEEFLHELQSLPDHNSKLRLAGDLADVLIGLAQDKEPDVPESRRVTDLSCGDSVQDGSSPEQEPEEPETLWYKLREELLHLALDVPTTAVGSEHSDDT